MTDDVERQPLLGLDTAIPVENNGVSGSSSTITTVSPIGPDELPPTYRNLAGGLPMVSCQVCNMIGISGKKDQYVVKCNSCNEASPIRSAPTGRKYVRCPCNCLLICKSSSHRLACPRLNCKRILAVAPSSPASTDSVPVPHVRVTCFNCHDIFRFNTMNVNNALAKCPHCRKVSSIGLKFARTCSIIFLIFGLAVLGIGIGITVASQKGGMMYVVYVGAFLVALLLLLRSLYYCSMKISLIEGPI